MPRLAVLLLLALLTGACVEIQPQVEITPGTIPPEIRSARWPQTPVAYCTVRDGQQGYVDHETFVTLAQQAMAAWGVPTTYAGDCDGPLAHNNGRNEIGWGVLEGDPGDLTEAGETNTRYVSKPGRPPDIVEADVTIHRNPASGKDTPECLYTTLLHEAGHLLGVNHLSESTIMSPVITECLQGLTAADRAAIDELY